MPTLRPLPRPRGTAQPRDYAVGDFEWRPSSFELSCLGAFDGREYRAYRTLDAYLRGEAGRHRETWFHAGGLADFTFIIHRLLELRRPFEIAPVGSAARRLDALGTCWLDSYFLLRAPLSDLGTGGLEKENIDYEAASFDDLAAYNETDNRLLYGAIGEFERVISRLGGRMRGTAAATSLDLFRRAFQTRPAYTPDPINEIIRTAYFASDVQPAARRADHCYIHDRNSSFPSEMRNPVPWRFLGRSRHSRPGTLGFALATITTPRKIKYPCIPVRAGNGGIYYPTGTVHGWYSELDIAYASELGCRVQTHEWLLFESNNDLAGFVNALAPARIQAKKDGQKFWAHALKIVQNSLYGKFGERRQKERVLYGRSTETSRMLYPGVHVEDEEVLLDHEQVHVSAWITSAARITLHRQYNGLANAGYQVFYWDTDSVFSTAPHVPGEGEELGEWGIVGQLFNGRWDAPKSYAGEFVDPKGSREYLVKAKGVAEISRLNRERRRAEKSGDELAARRADNSLRDRWNTLTSGDTLFYPTMRRFRSILGGSAPGEDIVSKAYRGRYPKRKFIGDHDSVAWDATELP